MTVRKRESIREMLAVGRHMLDSGRVSEVVEMVIDSPRRVEKLVECLWDEDAGVACRAADALEKASREKPKLLARWKPELLGLLPEATVMKVRWSLAAMVGRLPLSPAECRRAATTLKSWLDDKSSIVKTFSLQGLADIARQEPALLAEVVDLLRIHGRSGTPAMRARSRHLLKRLEGSEVSRSFRQDSKMQVL